MGVVVHLYMVRMWPRMYPPGIVPTVSPQPLLTSQAHSANIMCPAAAGSIPALPPSPMFYSSSYILFSIYIYWYIGSCCCPFSVTAFLSSHLLLLLLKWPPSQFHTATSADVAPFLCRVFCLSMKLPVTTVVTGCRQVHFSSDIV